MKKIRAAVFCVGLIAAFASCQKAYNPDGVVAGGSGGGSTGGTTGTLLVKEEAKTNGSTEATNTNYEYDASNRVIKITTVETDSSNTSKSYYYSYTRDAAGKITKITSNALFTPGTGYPDAVDITVHYPAGSSNPDYSSYSVNPSSIAVRDSTAYTYTAGNVTEVNNYQSVALLPLALASKQQFVYSNGNVVAEKVYITNGGVLTLVATYNYDFDTRSNPLSTGNEGALWGQSSGLISKNNPVKGSYFDNISNATLLTITYSLQYNANNLPTGGTALSVPGNKTTTFTFTYQ